MPPHETSSLRVHSERVPWMLLVCSLALILAVVGYLLWVSHGRDRLRFQGRIEKTVDEIQGRVETRLALIRATGGLFMGSEMVTREEFQAFVRSLDLPRRYPGLTGLGFARDRIVFSWPENSTLDWPAGERARARARDDDSPAASRRSGPTIQVYAPVYKRGLPSATTEQRKAAIDGFVYAELGVDSIFLDGLDPETAEEIALDVREGVADPEQAKPWSDTRTITLGGQPWTIGFRTRAAFQLRSSGVPIFYLLVAGLAFSAALFAISRAQVRSRGAAERIASRLTQSATALVRSEERGRRILEAALDAVVGMDLEGRITAWNRKAEEMFGWTESEALGRPLADTIIPAEYKEAHLRGMEAFRATGRGAVLNRRIEVTALRRDGKEFPVELSITPLGTGSGTTFSAFVRDLTDRKKTDLTLQESLDRFRIAAGSTSDLIYEWHLETGRVEWFGDVERGPHDFPRTRAAWEEMVHPSDLERFKAASGFLEYRMRAKNGEWRIWTDRAQAIPDRGGRPLKWIGSIADVSPQRALERDRERLLHRLQMQMERMPVACILTGPDFKIRLWNPAATKTFGFTREEAEGRPFGELLLPPESREQAAAHLRSFAEGLQSSITTWETVTRDGGRILCEWHSGPLLESDGSFAGLQSMAIDTTERARLEAQLLQSQKMEAVGRLAGGIAHDFNNLLTAVSGYSEILLDTLQPADAARAYVEEIREGAKRAADLTRQLLAFSRKQMLEPTVLDLNAVLSDMDKMLRRVIGEDINLVTSIDPELGRVKADRGQVEQVIMNLVVNARDAMPKGGKLILETKNVEIDATYLRQHPEASRGPHVLFAVTDSGAGIPAEVLPRIFEPFFTTKERGKGTGLGLATVYGIVKQSGGHITAYSEPGRGAVFKVYLSRVQDAVGAKPTPPEIKVAAIGTETILVVEDEAPVRKLMTQILRRHGYTLLEAPTGVDALEAISRHSDPIHLMVTDVVMPGMSGRDLAKRVETMRPQTKVLYISGYTEDAIVHHGELDPGTAFLPKPFTPAALAQKVREILG